VGEASAIEWLTGIGARVFVPLGHSPDCDLVADLDGQLVRVQVKTSRFFRARRWEIVLATRGGNRSWTGLVKRFTSDRSDFVFIHVADGRRWFILRARSAARPGYDSEARNTRHSRSSRAGHFEQVQPIKR
jgi:PD-(D/E)XK endonuclease